MSHGIPKFTHLPTATKDYDGQAEEWEVDIEEVGDDESDGGKSGSSVPLLAQPAQRGLGPVSYKSCATKL